MYGNLTYVYSLLLFSFLFSFLCSFIVGLKKLLEYPTDAAIILPKLECLGKQNQAMIREFIDALFPCNISLFVYGNPLYPVLENCCASMIQYYLPVAKEFGHSNAVIHRMATVASAVNLRDASFPLLPSRLVLAKWSELLPKDVRERKMGDFSKFSGEVNSISSTLNQMAVVLGSLQADVRELKIANGDQATTLVSQAAENVQFSSSRLFKST